VVIYTAVATCECCYLNFFAGCLLLVLQAYQYLSTHSPGLRDPETLKNFIDAVQVSDVVQSSYYSITSVDMIR
jgi:hypothetical protein